jgi:hypothetical protein
LESKYDYIACCEVVEHFYDPFREFKKLKDLLNPGGKLYCMTELYDQNTDFRAWYYKNDPTHVFFYSPCAISWIKEQFNFKEAKIEGRLIVFSASLESAQKINRQLVL